MASRTKLWKNQVASCSEGVWEQHTRQCGVSGGWAATKYVKVTRFLKPWDSDPQLCFYSLCERKYVGAYLCQVHSRNSLCQAHSRNSLGICEGAAS